MKKVILTGGIASGKTEVAKLFQEFGVPVIDADTISHNLFDINTPTYHQVIEYFGDIIVSKEDKTIDRAILGSLVFAKEADRKWLENVLHPKILAEIEFQISQLKEHSPTLHYCVIDVPLYAEIILSKNNKLSESFKKLADTVLVIDLDENTQYDRLLERYHRQNIQPDLGKIQAIIASQTPRIHRNKLADNIIVNNQDLSYLKTRLLKLHQHYINTLK